MIHRFGVFEFDAVSLELRKHGRLVALEPQPTKALALLLQRAGEVVTREEMRQAVWGAETHVDFDRGLAYCVSQIRTALGDSGDNPRYLQTIPKRGYRFIAPASASSASAPGASSASGAAASASRASRTLTVVMAVVGVVVVLGIAFAVMRSAPVSSGPAVIAVSIFDNETGDAHHDRLVAGLSDLVVARLASIDPTRIAVIGNAAVLRQPRNIRNLKRVADAVKADYVLLGQLQRGETGLRFITHFIRLSDEAHLKANRLQVPDGTAVGLEAKVVEEFERAVREHVLKPPAN